MEIRTKQQNGNQILRDPADGLDKDGKTEYMKIIGRKEPQFRQRARRVRNSRIRKRSSRFKHRLHLLKKVIANCTWGEGGL